MHILLFLFVWSGGAAFGIILVTWTLPQMFPNNFGWKVSLRSGLRFSEPEKLYGKGT